MNKGAKVGLVIALFVLLGVGGYYGYKMLYKPKEEEDDDVLILPPPNNDDGLGGGGSGSGATNYTFPFKTTEEGNKFRAWVNTNYPTYAREIKLDLTGALNSYVEKAWKKYGVEYSKISSVVLSKVDDADIKTIQGFAVKGVGADKSSDAYLKSTNPSFVKKWASRIRDKASAFEWANQVYRSKTGDLLLNWNPLKTTMYIKESGQNLRTAPNQTSSTSFREKGADLGKGGSFAHDGTYTYIYLPQERKWISSMRITRTKLSFTGDIEFEQFNGFTNDNE
jgi:hypothetical protein